ncbi:MAG: hypothetical protein LBR20_06685 [Propionibacteriaceae bacterium]|jgi:hypothetical protein|nr:hypothetical protein [Propionibacteriaceae bacterium]
MAMSKTPVDPAQKAKAVTFKIHPLTLERFDATYYGILAKTNLKLTRSTFIDAAIHAYCDQMDMKFNDGLPFYRTESPGTISEVTPKVDLLSLPTETA